MRNAKCLKAAHSVEQALDLLNLLANRGDNLNIRTIAERLGISRREARIMLIALETREFIRWDDKTKLYRTGRASIEMARRFKNDGETAELPRYRTRSTAVMPGRSAGMAMAAL